MSIKNRIEQARRAQEEQQAADQLSREQAREKHVAANRQQWIKFEQQLFQQNAQIDQCIWESKIPEYLSEAEQLLKADIEKAIALVYPASGGSDMYNSEQRWRDKIQESINKGYDFPLYHYNDIHGKTIFISNFSGDIDLSGQSTVFTLTWNRDIHYPEKNIFSIFQRPQPFPPKPEEISNDHICIAVNLGGTITIFFDNGYHRYGKTISMEPKEWRTNPMIVEQNISNAILNPTHFIRSVDPMIGAGR
jgi:hypothetical protein